MAGGKETPRQKLIGMMYLVLTALLALQVSSAIILKFKFLDDSLMAVNAKTSDDNVGRIKGIEKAVAERKGAATAKDKRVLSDATLVRTRTAEIIKYLNDTRNSLIQKAGGTNPDGSYKDPSAEDLVAI
jgi:gliding motility-associated protein GldM